ncbi:MAG TPA: prepilin-type N-terminal cleavage/methylation domain-containing protein [Terriglobales bacterium]|nr:prepilin-type N-terminal cleavage/methylation domain-containing protein [Terriglobales bacterium]
MRNFGVTPNRKRAAHRGFSLIEAMFAIAILGIGLCALMAMFGSAVYAMQYAQEDQIAKQKAREALEAAISARNDTAITFDDLQNVSNGGIFKDGFQMLYLAGDNGIPGTGHDTSILDRVVFPGPDGKLGTDDDVFVPLSNYRRQILISPVYNNDNSLNTDMRKITVTVRVDSAKRGAHDYVVSAFISRFN